jgi:hypothetical protein
LSTTAGFHAPLIPLLEVDGRVGTTAPAQMLREGPNANVGVTMGLTVTSKLVVVAHSPDVGVKV